MTETNLYKKDVAVVLDLIRTLNLQLKILGRMEVTDEKELDILAIAFEKLLSEAKFLTKRGLNNGNVR